jgi:hypothetical protein
MIVNSASSFVECYILITFSGYLVYLIKTLVTEVVVLRCTAPHACIDFTLVSERSEGTHH